MKRYYPSKYNIVELTGNGWLCWNTFTGAFLRLDGAEAEYLSGTDSPVMPQTFAPQRYEELCEEGILVPEGYDELAALEEEIAEDASSGVYRILTTTACNAACAYCYEKGIKPVTMDRRTALETAEFIRMMRSAGGKYPVLQWFGGEPLLNHEAMDLICRELRAEGMHYISRIVTNGSLWTEELIRTAVDLWNLRRVQVTLDGTGALHERAKRLPEGTYRKTLQSILRLSENDIHVSIRINHLPGRSGGEADLIRELAVYFPDPDRIDIYVTPAYRAAREYARDLMTEVLALERMIRDLRPRCGKGRTSGNTDGHAAERSSILPRRRHSGCFMCGPGNFTIAPDGRLYNCSHAMTPDQCVGSVHEADQVKDSSEHRQAFLRRRFSDDCRACRLLPVCMGGCRSAELGLAPMTQCLACKSVIRQLMEDSVKQ